MRHRRIKLERHKVSKQVTGRCEKQASPARARVWQPVSLGLILAIYCFKFEVSLARAQTRGEQLEREADAAARAGGLAQAEQNYRELTRLAPQDADNYHNLGIICFREGKYHDAAEALEKAVQLRPLLVAAHVLLGRTYYELNQLEKAVVALQTALRLKPTDPDALFYFGEVQIQRGNYQAASDALKKLAESRPADPNVIHALSLCYMKLMEENVRHQGNYAPNSYQSYLLLALDAEARKDYVTAIGYYREALQAKPDALGIHYALGSDLARLGRNDEAVQEFKKELEINPDDWQALWKLGVHTLHTDPQKAREHLERAVSLNPQNPQTVISYGRALLLNGETAKAVQQFLRVTQLAPEMASPHYLLATAYRRLGRNEEAKVELVRFEDLAKKSSERRLEQIHPGMKTDRLGQELDAFELDSPPSQAPKKQ